MPRAVVVLPLLTFLVIACRSEKPREGGTAARPAEAGAAAEQQAAASGTEAAASAAGTEVRPADVRPMWDTLRVEAVATSPDRQVAIDKAVLQARQVLADSIRGRLGPLANAMAREAGLPSDSASSSLAARLGGGTATDVVKGSRIVSQHLKRKKKIWRAVVVVTCPMAAAYASFVAAVGRDAEGQALLRGTPTYRLLASAGGSPLAGGTAP